jgi:MOSC domain-containing protein YiiM
LPGSVIAINISSGGVPKSAVFESFVSEDGVSGDVQADRTRHGGPDRAVVLFSLELIRALQREGHPIVPGSAGENVTVSGIEWTRVTPGARLRIGGAVVEITRYATPCFKIGGSFTRGQFMRIAQAEHPGWSRACARVIDPGIVRPGDAVELLA